MFTDIPKKPCLLVISDTALTDKNGSIYGFGPVVKELTEVSELFSQIHWIGYRHPDRTEDRSLIPVPYHITCTLLKKTGGHGLLNKIKICIQLPVLIITLLKLIPRYDVVHTRAPSVPAFVGILCSLFFHRKKKWWHKYAGNWIESDMPLSYALQKKLLLRASHSKVTLNGQWPGLPNHCIPFENPCVYAEELHLTPKVFRQDEKLSLCFVGALNPMKGVNVLLEALQLTGTELFNNIYIIGGGPDLTHYKDSMKTYPNVVFTGYLPRPEIIEMLKKSEFLVLPSYSEGFPKVIAEAACFGVIPIVTAVSSIPQYINEKNGFLLKQPDSKELSRTLFSITEIQRTTLSEMSLHLKELARLFTYQRFVERVRNEILI